MTGQSIHHLTSSEPHKSKAKIFPYLILFLILIFAFGVIGYKYLFGGRWSRAFFDTAITVSTLELGRADEVKTISQEVFVSVLALLSGVIFLTFAAYIVTHLLKYYE